VIVHCGQGQVRRCWACTVQKEVRSRLYRHPRDGFHNWTSWELYESAVEAVESMGDKGFRMVDVWLRAGGGPARYSYARLAVHDMAMHGLVIPVEFRSDNKVQLWRAVEAKR